jgi:hypothetical protein
VSSFSVNVQIWSQRNGFIASAASEPRLFFFVITTSGIGYPLKWWQFQSTPHIVDFTSFGRCCASLQFHHAILSSEAGCSAWQTRHLNTAASKRLSSRIVNVIQIYCCCAASSSQPAAFFQESSVSFGIGMPENKCPEAVHVDIPFGRCGRSQPTASSITAAFVLRQADAGQRTGTPAGCKRPVLGINRPNWSLRSQHRR